MANRKDIRTPEFEFKPFSKKQQKLFTCWHEDSPMKDKFMIVADGSVRSGKEQPLDAKILTPTGWTTMGELEEFQEIISGDGAITEVIGIYPQGTKDVWRLTFNDGSTAECGLEHLWKVYNSPRIDCRPMILEFRDIKEWFEDGGRLSFPLCKEVYAEGELENPYIQGVILACGYKQETGYKISSENLDCHEKIAEHFAYGYDIRHEVGIGYLEYDKVNFEDILTAKIEHRKEVARGIIDAVGIEVRNGKNEKPSIHIRMRTKEDANLVLDLFRSLGHFTRREKHNPNFCIEVAPFISKELTGIEYVGKKECQCIMVDHEDHTYVTDNYCVTHNTVAMSLSFVLFVMSNFNDSNAAITSKSVGSARRNIIPTLKQMLQSIGYEVIDHRSENYLEIRNGDIINYFFIFGGERTLPPLYGNILKIN